MTLSEAPSLRPPSAGLGRRRGRTATRGEGPGAVPPRPFTQPQGSPLQHALQLLPATARHGPGQVGAPPRGHLLPGHLLGHELAGEARRAQHHQLERPRLGLHDEPTASGGPGQAERTTPAPQTATQVPGAATAPDVTAGVAASCAPRSRGPRAAAPGPRPSPRRNAPPPTPPRTAPPLGGFGLAARVAGSSGWTAAGADGSSRVRSLGAGVGPAHL